MFYIAYKIENGRMISFTLSGQEEISRDHAELLSKAQAENIARKHGGKVMSEDDWFSY